MAGRVPAPGGAVGVRVRAAAARPAAPQQPRVRAKARLGTVDRSASYRRVDPRTGVVPALATGRLASREPGGLVLAIAVDERIRATARSYRQAGTTRFAAMLPESALPAGAHHVEVFAVGSGGALRPVAGSAAG